MAKALRVQCGIGVCHKCYGFAWCTSCKEHKKAKKKNRTSSSAFMAVLKRFDAMNLIARVSPFLFNRIKNELYGNLSRIVSPCLLFPKLVLSSLKAFFC